MVLKWVTFPKGFHFLGIYQLTLRKCILTGRVINTDSHKGRKSKVPMLWYFLNARRSLPMIKSWLPVIYQLITPSKCVSSKVEVFPPTSLCPLSNIYHETQEKIYLKIQLKQNNYEKLHFSFSHWSTCSHFSVLWVFPSPKEASYASATYTITAVLLWRFSWSLTIDWEHTLEAKFPPEITSDYIFSKY